MFRRTGIATGIKAEGSDFDLLHGKAYFYFPQLQTSSGATTSGAKLQGHEADHRLHLVTSSTPPHNFKDNRLTREISTGIISLFTYIFK
jgi:hypothetical protein